MTLFVERKTELLWSVNTDEVLRKTMFEIRNITMKFGLTHLHDFDYVNG